MDNLRASVVIVALLMTAAGCTDSPATTAARSSPTATLTSQSPVEESTPVEPDNEPAKRDNPWVTHRPDWLGTRVLPMGAEGFGEIRPTPPILRNRRFPTIDVLPKPSSDRFTAEVGPVPASVVKRSTYREKCPVGLDDLSYVTMAFWGFDHEAHNGEMIVNASVADQIVGVFRDLYRARFPIEDMHVVTLPEQRAWYTAPTGDTNVTSSFECRKATLGSTWSMHAYGLAVDINPFHNPFARGELVAPELASAYVNRGWVRPGMILEGSVATRAFDEIGWGWGGRWNTTSDWMHFSQNGR